MKIAIDAVGIRSHGGAAVLHEFLHWLPLARPGWKWHVFLSDRGAREFDDPSASGQVTIENAKKEHGSWSRMRWVNSLLQKRVKEIGADRIFSFANIGTSKPAAPQVVFCQQPNVFFSEADHLRPFSMNAKLFFLRRAILRGLFASKAVIVQTEAMQDRILELSPALSGRMHVIPSGLPACLDTELVRPDKKALIDSCGTPRFIYVSAMRPPKNHMVLIKALPGILRVFPGASLMLTGDPENRSDPEVGKFAIPIHRAARELGVEDHIVWLGYLNRREIDYVFMNSGLSFFPSLTESFGLPLVEAMAAGCPLAASDLPYAHDVAADAAIYFDPFDAGSVADSAIKILKDDKLRQLLLAKGALRKKLFDWPVISNRIASVLEL